MSVDSFIFREPIVEATYPSFIIISWSHPTSATETRVGWKYHVEWSQALTLDAAQFQEDISYTHIVLPIDFSTEFCVVRVTARGRILTSPDNVADLVLASSLVVPGPYRFSTAWTSVAGQPLSRIVLDACVLCGSPNFDLRALRPFLANVTVKDAEYVGNGLTKAASMTAVRVQYSEVQPPLTSAVVYFLMVEDVHKSGSGGHAGNVTFATVQQWAAAANSSVVVCGFGSNGVLAAKLTHLLLASIDASGDKDARHNAFCVTYGSPSLEFFSLADAMVLSGTARYAGNFLHYTSLPLSMIEQGFIRTRPFNATASSAGTSGGGGSSGGGSGGGGGSQPSSPARGSSGANFVKSSALSAPLGTRCCVSLSPRTGKAVAELHLSSFERRSEEEMGETLTLPDTLPPIYAAVHDVSLAEAALAFSPCVENCGCSISDSAFMDVVITGQHLHIEPKIFVCVGGSGNSASSSSSIVAVRVVSCAPTKVVGSISILALPSTVELRGDIEVEVSITTAFGCDMSRACMCAVPVELAAIAAPTPKGPDSWLRGSPAQLIQNSIVVEALLTSITSGQFHPCPSTRILAEVEHVAEILHAAIPSNVNVSIFARVANAAARAVQSGPLPPLPLPKIARKEFMATALAEYLRGDDPTTKLRQTFTPWLTRIVAAMPWLDEAAYTARLKALIVFLLGAEAGGTSTVAERCVQLPLILVESALHGLIFRMLRRVSVRSMKATDRLPAVLSFEAFYDALLPVLQQRGVPPADMLLDAAFLWTSAMIFQLRKDYLFSKLVVVTGSHGSGRTTVTNELKKLAKELADISVDRREMMILVRRSTRPPLIRDVLQLGLPMSLVVTGEITDVESFEMVELFRSMKAAAVFPKAQFLHPIVTKIDECLDDAEISADGGDAVEWCRRSREVLERKCATVSRDFMATDGAVLLAVQPKKHFKALPAAADAAAVCRELHGVSQRVLGGILVE